MSREEFNNYVRIMSRKLYGFAFRILKDKEESEDAVQEVFLRMWNMGKKLDNYDRIDALATTMTKNYCIDQLRKQRNTFRNDDTVSDRVAETPVEMMERLESDNIIMDIIGRMPAIYREILNLKDIDGLSYEEISAKTGQNINTLRVTLSRARAMLREKYKKHFDEKRGA